MVAVNGKDGYGDVDIRVFIIDVVESTGFVVSLMTVGKGAVPAQTLGSFQRHHLASPAHMAFLRSSSYVRNA